jgi:hypothetical protein
MAWKGHDVHASLALVFSGLCKASDRAVGACRRAAAVVPGHELVSWNFRHSGLAGNWQPHGEISRPSVSARESSSCTHMLLSASLYQVL